MTDIEIKTRSIYDELSPAEQKVAWYFLQNLGSVFDDPIAVLAEKSGVSQVMWVRFCKALGFSGLKDMKKTCFSSSASSARRSPRQAWIFWTRAPTPAWTASSAVSRPARLRPYAARRKFRMRPSSRR
ncbi:MAG: MurR/RpiR family transcriptional regulator [Oscillospiraceae bacterium]